MTLTLAPKFILFSPIFIVFVLLCLAGVRILPKSPGGDESLIAGMMAISFPVIGTPIFAAVYLFAAWMGHNFWR